MLPFPIGITYGAYFLSTIFCAMLLGVSCTQTFSYFTRYVRDDRWLKTTVAVIFTMNAVQTALVAHGVTHFGDSSFFEVVLPVSSTGFLLSAVVSVCVQGIFVVKAQRLSETRSRVLPSLWIPLALFELGAAIYCVDERQAMTFALSEMIQRLIIFSMLSGIWTALFALLDMVTYLGFPNTAVYVLFDLPLCSLYCNTLLLHRDR
ncbi:uncharacterized protein BJ212DRAFT_212243 [Suillus subaureus]|uniref:DUF6534 domain-containing protein n=1 Tax=Suillus subaureus TaxID=48587 RepID=A0A9P7EAL6_9AGAM|nr:uncharacterized protein BJ212DRAFT_212243 [Suillus subaureus]KAG1816109.1 hypothetical protein BJ212DRAFT_212243 [Suillus subaureus]